MASLPKSRYESISLYLANCAGCQTKYCDLDAPVDEVSVGMLTEAGIDITLARHIAHLFVRDPLVIHQERLHLSLSLSLTLTLSLSLTLFLSLSLTLPLSLTRSGFT